jgi:sugar diacid utilization regulator
MFDGRDEDGIMALSLSGLASLGCFLPPIGYLLRENALVRRDAATAGHHDDTAVDTLVSGLQNKDSPLDLPGCAWSWAYALCGAHGRAGFLVVRASTVPTQEQRLLAGMLAHQTSAALANLTVLRRERSRVRELRRRTEAQAADNAVLRTEVAESERRRRALTALAEVSVSGEGEEGILRVLHEHTGLTAMSEDSFGNLRAWRGSRRPGPCPVPEPGRQELLRRAQQGNGPVRDRERLLTLAQPHGEVLGAVALVDPSREAAEFETFVLEHAAMVLALELTHARSLAEVELKLRRDLVEDLITSTDEDSAFARSEAVGHDLHGPHRAAVVEWTTSLSERTVVAAVRRAATGLGVEFLLGRRSGAAVLLLRGEEATDSLHEAISEELGSTAGAIGVGGRCGSPAGFPRSYEEALQALHVRQRSRAPHGLTTVDELGIYRVLDKGDAGMEMERFVDEWLGPLLDYDATHHADLVSTLSAYLDCGGAYTASSAALMIHRSTLRYRLQRIREIADLDLADVDVRLNLHVATRIWRVLT